jgi:hypothetical protein
MAKISAKQRSDSRAVSSVMDSVFEGSPKGSKQSYLKFLAISIDTLPHDRRDRWGATLFDWGVRLTSVG